MLATVPSATTPPRHPKLRTSFRWLESASIKLEAVYVGAGNRRISFELQGYAQVYTNLETLAKPHDHRTSL